MSNSNLSPAMSDLSYSFVFNTHRKERFQGGTLYCGLCDQRRPYPGAVVPDKYFQDPERPLETYLAFPVNNSPKDKNEIFTLHDPVFCSDWNAVLWVCEKCTAKFSPEFKAKTPLITPHDFEDSITHWYFAEYFCNRSQRAQMTFRSYLSSAWNDEDACNYIRQNLTRDYQRITMKNDGFWRKRFTWESALPFLNFITPYLPSHVRIEHNGVGWIELQKSYREIYVTTDFYQFKECINIYGKESCSIINFEEFGKRIRHLLAKQSKERFSITGRVGCKQISGSSTGGVIETYYVGQ